MKRQEKENAEPPAKLAAETSGKRQKRKRQTSGIGNERKKRFIQSTCDPLSNAPAEVLFSILQHVTPGDLLNVSRTSKYFRATLYNPKHRFIWVALLDKVAPPLPPCPPDISEPAYSALIFGRTCNFCGKGRASRMNMACRLRWCGACDKSKRGFVELGQYMPSPPFMTDDAVEDVLPAVVVRKKGHGLASFVPQGIWDAFVEDQTECLRREEELKTEDSTEDLTALHNDFRNRRLEIMQDLQEHASLYDEWKSAQAVLNAEEKRKARENCIEWVRRQLVRMNSELEQEIAPMTEEDRNKLITIVGKDAPLTEDVWNARRDRIIESLREARSSRLSLELTNFYVEALQAFVKFLDSCTEDVPPELARPSVADLCLHPSVRHNIIEPLVRCVAGNLPFDFSEAWGFVSSASHEWRYSFQETLQEIARLGINRLMGERVGDLNGVDLNPLACTWFVCEQSACDHETLHMEQAMNHTCLRAHPDIAGGPADNLQEALFQLTGNCLRTTPWRIRSCIKFSERAFKRARKILFLYDLSSHASLADAESMRIRIACAKCEVIMTWKRTLVHECKRRSQEPAEPADEAPGNNEDDLSSIQLLPDTAAWHAMSLEHPNPYAYPNTPLICNYCHPWDPSLATSFRGTIALNNHLHEEHDIQRPNGIVHPSDYMLKWSEHESSILRAEPRPVPFRKFLEVFGHGPLDDDAHLMPRPVMLQVQRDEETLRR